MGNRKHYFQCWEMQLSCQPAAVGSPAQRDKWDQAWRGRRLACAGQILVGREEDEFVRTQTWVALESISYRCPQRNLVTPAPAEHRSQQRAMSTGCHQHPKLVPPVCPQRASRDFKGKAFMVTFSFTHRKANILFSSV